QLPVGASDAWVTAYVGWTLARMPGGDERGGARRAANWLLDTRSYAAGWGYNGRTGADADSTAWALLLFRALGLQSEARDQDWLVGCWRPEGGFATYNRRDAWGVAHPDVSPVAFLALLPDRAAALRPSFLAYTLRNRLPNGTWPAYWWRTGHYSTY